MASKLIKLVLIFSILIAGCAPKKNSFRPSRRYIKKASKEEVFFQMAFVFSSMTGGIGKETDFKEGYIRSVIYMPHELKKKHKIPTRYYLDGFIKKEEEKGSEYYVPYIHLSAEQSKDRGRTWKSCSVNNKLFKEYLEETVRNRILILVSGFLHNLLKPGQFLGIIVRKDNVPVYETPAKENVLFVSKRYQFGELQFKGYRPLTVYEKGLLRAKFELTKGEKTVGWIDEHAIKLFMFSFINTPGTVGAFRELYKESYIREVCRQIGILKGKEEGWDKSIIDAIINGSLRQGMTEEQVVAALGPPTETSVQFDSGKGAEVTIYTYKEFGKVIKRVTFVNGKAANR